MEILQNATTMSPVSFCTVSFFRSVGLSCSCLGQRWIHQMTSEDMKRTERWPETSVLLWLIRIQSVSITVQKIQASSILCQCCERRRCPKLWLEWTDFMRNSFFMPEIGCFSTQGMWCVASGMFLMVEGKKDSNLKEGILQLLHLYLLVSFFEC